MIVKLLGPAHDEEGAVLTNMSSIIPWIWGARADASPTTGIRLARTQQTTENTEGNDGR